MQIVIDIPDDFYERVNKDGCMSYTDAEVVVNAFYLGKALPKGHGRLKDESDIVAQSVHYFNGTKTLGQCLDDCPTLVEADKEVDDADSN